MALKPHTKKTSLAFMGEGWGEAYLESRLMVGEDQEALDTLQNDKDLNPHQQAVAIVKMFFVAGKGVSTEDELVDLTKEDIDSLDLFTLGELAGKVGMPVPKASESSTPTTEELEQSQNDSLS